MKLERFYTPAGKMIWAQEGADISVFELSQSSFWHRFFEQHKNSTLIDMSGDCGVFALYAELRIQEIFILEQEPKIYDQCSENLKQSTLALNLVQTLDQCLLKDNQILVLKLSLNRLVQKEFEEDLKRLSGRVSCVIIQYREGFEKNWIDRLFHLGFKNIERFQEGAFENCEYLVAQGSVVQKSPCSIQTPCLPLVQFKAPSLILQEEAFVLDARESTASSEAENTLEYCWTLEGVPQFSPFRYEFWFEYNAWNLNFNVPTLEYQFSEPGLFRVDLTVFDTKTKAKNSSSQEILVLEKNYFGHNPKELQYNENISLSLNLGENWFKTNTSEFPLNWNVNLLQLELEIEGVVTHEDYFIFNEDKTYLNTGFPHILVTRFPENSEFIFGVFASVDRNIKLKIRPLDQNMIHFDVQQVDYPKYVPDGLHGLHLEKRVYLYHIESEMEFFIHRKMMPQYWTPKTLCLQINHGPLQSEAFEGVVLYGSQSELIEGWGVNIVLENVDLSNHLRFRMKFAKATTLRMSWWAF